MSFECVGLQGCKGNNSKIFGGVKRIFNSEKLLIMIGA
jgi:hypothetical protein